MRTVTICHSDDCTYFGLSLANALQVTVHPTDLYFLIDTRAPGHKPSISLAEAVRNATAVKVRGALLQVRSQDQSDPALSTSGAAKRAKYSGNGASHVVGESTHDTRMSVHLPFLSCRCSTGTQVYKVHNAGSQQRRTSKRQMRSCAKRWARRSCDGCGSQWRGEGCNAHRTAEEYRRTVMHCNPRVGSTNADRNHRSGKR